MASFLVATDNTSVFIVSRPSMQPAVYFFFFWGVISWSTIMGYSVYTSLCTVQRQLVDLLLDFPHEVFDGWHFSGDGCDSPSEISVFR